jgi:hypothetical protein
MFSVQISTLPSKHAPKTYQTWKSSYAKQPILYQKSSQAHGKLKCCKNLHCPPIIEIDNPLKLFNHRFSRGRRTSGKRVVYLSIIGGNKDLEFIWTSWMQRAYGLALKKTRK